MRVVYDVRAEADLLALEPTAAIEILDRMDRFAVDGRGFVRRMLDHTGVWRLYVDEYLVTFRLLDEEMRVMSVERRPPRAR